MSQLDDLRDQRDHLEAEAHKEWSPLSRLNPNVTRRTVQLENSAIEAKKITRHAAETARNHAENDLIPAEARDRLVHETISKARREAREHLATMQTCATIIRKEVEHALLPPVDPAREMAARDELRLLVDSSPDPLAALEEAASRSRELASVALSSYGESLLRAHGVRRAADAHEGVKASAMFAALKSDDPTTRLAAQAYAKVDLLTSITAAVTDTVNDHLSPFEA